MPVVFEGVLDNAARTPASYGWVVTALAFRRRFTPSERARIDLASIDDPSAVLAQRQQAAAIRQNQSDLSSATYVQLDRPDLISDLAALESAGLLDVGGAARIASQTAGSVELPTSLRLQFGLPEIPSPEELALNGGRGYLSPGGAL